MTTVLESLMKVRPHIISHVTFVVSALYKTMNQNELEKRVENSRLSIFRSHVRSTFIIAARKKVCCCTPRRAAANYQLYSSILFLILSQIMVFSSYAIFLGNFFFAGPQPATPPQPQWKPGWLDCWPKLIENERELFENVKKFIENWKKLIKKAEISDEDVSKLMILK